MKKQILILPLFVVVSLFYACSNAPESAKAPASATPVETAASIPADTSAMATPLDSTIQKEQMNGRKQVDEDEDDK